MNNKIIISLLASCIYVHLYATILIDTNFGVNGLASIASGTGAVITKIAVQADGKIVVLGMSDLDTSPTIFLARLTVEGSLDTTFNTSGVITLQYGTNVFARSLAVQPDGKILIAGYTVINDVPQILMARYTSAGVLDTTFGSGGIVTQLINQNTTINAIALQTINQATFIIVTGQTFINQAPCGYIARYDNKGAPDTMFGVGGVVTIQRGQIVTPAALTVQNNSKILLAGSVFDGSQKILLAQYMSDGSPDQDFGTQGYVTTSVPGSDDDSVADLLVQADGIIVIVGRSQINGVGAVLIARYLGQGIPDENFGIHGITTTPFDSEAHASSVSMKPDGTYTVSAAIGADGTLLRYLSNGTLDTTFGVDGLIKSTLTSAMDSYPSFLDASEKIILGGSVDDNGAIVRYRVDSSDFIVIKTPVDGSTISSHIFALSGLASQSNYVVNVLNQGLMIGNVTTDSYGNWHVNTSKVVPNGAYTFIVSLMHGQDVIASATSDFTVDAGNDMIVIDAPVSGSTVTTATPGIEGSSSRGSKKVSVKLDGTILATVDTEIDGSWELAYPEDYTSTIPSGSHTLIADLIDGEAVLATTLATITSAVVSTCTQIMMLGGTFLTSNPPRYCFRFWSFMSSGV